MPDQELIDLLSLIDDITRKYGLSASKTVEILEWDGTWRELGDPLPEIEEFTSDVEYYLEMEKEAIAKGITVFQAMSQQRWIRVKKPDKDNASLKLVPFPGGRDDDQS
jgi:hypothetical protein